MDTIDLTKYIVPIRARHIELSLLASADDDVSQPNEFLLDLALEAIHYARKIDLNDIALRMTEPPFWPNVWPGEHYKLLAGFILALKPAVVVEIGTAQGLSALSMKKFLPDKSSLVSFDIVPWREYANTSLRESDFSDSFRQLTDNLIYFENVLKHRALLEAADFMFIDAAKDGTMEYKLLENLEKINLKSGSILLFDDTRLWPMLAFWRGLRHPKLDLTSFGHWAGTGIMQWQNGRR